MAGMLVITQKTLGGDVWTNTHGVMVGPNGATQPTDDDLTAIGAASTITTANTANASATNIIQAIVAFEAILLAADAAITRVYVTDGKRNDLTSVDSYAVLSCNIPGRGMGGVALLGALAPGAITLMLNRNPVGFSHRPGRLFLRASLSETGVRFGGPKMVDWENASQRTDYVAAVAAAVTNSRLGLYFFGGASAATATYGVPVYYSTKNAPTATQVGELRNLNPVGSMSVAGPAIRQANRGRRRKKGGGAVAI